MRCPQCQFENADKANFCNECGGRLEISCSKCGKANGPGSKFCNECGNELKELQAVAPVDFTKPRLYIPKRPADKVLTTRGSIDGERKLATVLFSDLGDYTALTEKLDPEEVREIMGLIFREIARLAKSYDGTIERFFGDEVLMLFGVPKAHEDDPIRAIRAAIEINALIDRQSARFAEKIGRPLAMHIGINTGLVITGDEYIEKGRHGLTGDAINLGARLGRLSKPGEILVGPETYRQAMHHFEFESLGTSEIKGKAEPIQIYKVLSLREQPQAFHQIPGARAVLIGRDQEMAVLEQAVQQLSRGRAQSYPSAEMPAPGKAG
ncbi:MAG: adenylate/guanylate cyclase domain-containing protein [Desulfobacterales bacterium]